tara:strand:- start:394 stop:600 length:207 start_codon:yes stop_codon:yes gene_type:complete
MEINKLKTIATEDMEHLEHITADLAQTTSLLVDCIKDLSALPKEQQKYTAEILSTLVKGKRGRNEQVK